MSMDTDRVAEIIHNTSRDLSVYIDRNELITALAFSFKAQANQRRANCICGPDCAAEDCNFNQVEFKRIAMGV